ncbi:MAG TPA: serine/threonine protein kinase [Puia sp.]|jgi:anti-sigma regulatory factor (Ser/Thr protein kinase)
MVNTQHKVFRADDRSYFSLIKKDIHSLATSVAFDEQKVGKIDIVVSELTSNLSKYAKGGDILAGVGEDHHGVYLEIICTDSGPGIADLSRMLSDGYSSTSTLGHGLGSVKRLSDTFDMFSLKDFGTIVLSRIYRDDLPRFRRKQLECQGVNIPKTGELLSGDGYCLVEQKDGFRLLIADGLGHGPHAHEAVKKAAEAFQACGEESPTEILRFIHSSIRKTRGIVGTVVRYDAPSRKWTIAGVGNISVKWLSPTNTRNHICYNGIIGYNIPGSMNDQLVSQEEFPQFVACSDGIRSRWDFARFPTVLQHHGTIIATALYKEFARGTDDSSVIVCKSV